MYAYANTNAYMEDNGREETRFHEKIVRLFRPLAEKKLEIHVTD
jgi:hypothetical protein